MSSLDVLARRHADEAHAAVAGVRAPQLDRDTMKGRTATVPVQRPQPSWVTVAVVVSVAFIIALPWLLGSGRESGPAITVPQPPPTTVPATTVPNPPPPVSGEFVPTGDLQHGCAWCDGVLLPDGRVLVLGGRMMEGDERPSAELFDPESGTFTETGVPGDDFNQGSGVHLEDGRVLVAFGLSERADIYDPVSGEFHPTGITYPQGQDGSAAALDNGDVLLIFGDGTLAIYDPGADALTSIGSAPIQTETATVLSDGRVLVTGAGTAGIIDPAVGRFYPVDMLAPRTGHTATRLAAGQVLIAGGDSPDEPFEPISAAELFDPTTARFVATGSLKLSRSFHAATLLEDGRVLIVGGTPSPMIGSRDAPGMAEYDHAEIYDPGSGTFGLVNSPMSQPRIAPTAVTLLDGRVLVLGNYPGNLGPTDGSGTNTSEVFLP